MTVFGLTCACLGVRVGRPTSLLFLHDQTRLTQTCPRNEASNFCNGPCQQQKRALQSEGEDVGFDPENPPYPIGGAKMEPLDTATISPSAQQYGGRHYDLHNMYGFMETVVTMQAMHAIRKGKRSIVVSRSTFVGHGAHGSHWLGDNTATWDDLHSSIPHMLDMGLFGVPLIGTSVSQSRRDQYSTAHHILSCSRFACLQALTFVGSTGRPRLNYVLVGLNWEPSTLTRGTTTASVSLRKSRTSLETLW